MWYNLLIEGCGSSLCQLNVPSLKLFRTSSSNREGYLHDAQEDVDRSQNRYNALCWSPFLMHGVLKSVSFFFRNHSILKTSPTCCGQSDSSQHRIVLGPGEESKTPRASGSVVQVLHRRGRPQSAHLRSHLYVGAASNCVTFCFDALISWDGFYCFQNNSF